MKAWIFTGGPVCAAHITARPDKDDLCIAADAGLVTARSLGVSVSAVVGDYDSLGARPDVGPDVEVVTVPTEKDVTDTQLAVEYALKRGARELCIVGGLGGRLDHTLSNLAILEDTLARGVRTVIEDGYNRVRLLHNDSTILPRSNYRYVSLLSLDEKAKGVEIDGVKYPLKKATLHRALQYAVSNEITGNCCFIAVRRGKLLIVESRDMS